MLKMHTPWAAYMRNRTAVRVLAYGLAGAGGVIYAAQLEHVAIVWAVLVAGYAIALVHPNVARLAR